MILIGGADISKDDLPFNEIMEYAVESSESILAIKLKTVAKSDMCLGVYLHSSLSGLEITEDVKAKTKYFDNSSQLMNLLENGGSEEVHDTLDATLDTENTDDGVQVFEAPQPKESPASEPTLVSVDVPFEGVIEIEEVDTELPDMILEIPNIGDDRGSLHQIIENKNAIIHQKDGIILDMTTQINDIYKLQEIQMLEMKGNFEAKIDEANTIIAELTEKASQVKIPPELQSFLKYAAYSKNPKAGLREEFTPEEKALIGKPSSPLYIFTGGSGESVHSMLQNVRALVEKKTNAIIVDFTSDLFFEARYRLKTRDSSIMLDKDDVEVMNIIKDLNGIRYIPTTVYNDIALLSMDWAKIIKKLMVYASGKPIILLFNNINSFSVKYTVSKLATVGQLHVFARCNPIILSTLLSELKFIPEERVRIIAMDYIPEVQQILEAFAKTYSVITFKDTVIWSKTQMKL